MRSLFFKGVLSTILFLIYVSALLAAKETTSCNIKNRTTYAGEKLSYKVYYTVAGVYIHAGEAIFSNQLAYIQKKPVYHLKGFGKTIPSYDWFYKVYDLYESFVDTSTMLPFKFTRNVKEGRTVLYNEVIFERAKLQAVSNKKVYTIPACVQDVLSMIYYARNIDFSKYRSGDKIPFDLFLDDTIYPLYIRYLGKEKLKTRYGNYNTIVFRPRLIPGTLFSSGDGMLVHVSDDDRRIPVYIETPILVGKIKVYFVP